MKAELEENSGKVKADLGLLQSDQKVTAEEIKLIDESLKETVQDVAVELKPALTDIQATVDVLKDAQAKHQERLDELGSPLAATAKLRRQNSKPAVDNSMNKDQLKRILTLIENNSQAMALQRETFTNVMVRIQVLERNMNMGLGQWKSNTQKLP